MSGRERHTVLLTDLVDSTQLSAELGDARVLEVWQVHDRTARDLLEKHAGREIDKSDGFLFLFHRPADAMRFALDYHRALRHLSGLFGVPLAARAGLHEGDVTVTRNSDADIARGAKTWEVEGIAKPVAARVMSVALGGQTLLTGPARAALTEQDAVDSTGEVVRLLLHGHYRMKGLPDPVEVFEAVIDGAPAVPPVDAPKAYRVVRDGEGWRPARELPTNLPPGRAAFFGRHHELRAIGDLFDGGARLVSLVGTGGIGKSALAQRYATSFLGGWPGGAWLADLSDARSAADVHRAVGAALGVPLEQGDDPVATLGAALRSRGRALILLDTFERLVALAPATVGRWLDLAPEAGFLVTTRQRLGLRGERVLPVDPLPASGGEEGAVSPAAALFVDRARAVHPDLVIDSAQLAAIARLVEMLDGLPLAIELAAARVKVLPPTRILERMGRRFDVLRGGTRGAPDRQATLRGAIDASWELLDDAGRAALAQVSVFEGGFDLEAAEGVVDLNDCADAPWTLDVVEALVEQSLVRSVQDASGNTRFQLLQSIREYAAEKLGDVAARGDVEARHAAWYASFGAEDALDGPPARRQRVVADLDNLVAAARRPLGEDAALAALGALFRLQDTGPFALARELVEQAAGQATTPLTRARLSVADGVVRVRAGQLDAARAPLEEALAAAKSLRARRVEADALAALGQRALLQGGLEEARERYTAALALARAVGDLRVEAGVHAELAHVIGIRGGNLDEARPHLDAALALHARRQDPAGEAMCSSYLGALHAIRGSFDEGLAAYQRARDLARSAGDKRTEGLSEGMIAAVLALLGQTEASRSHFEAALQVQGSIGDRVHEAMHAVNYGDLLVRLGEGGRARDLLHHAVALATEAGAPAIEGSARSALGALLLASGAFEPARDELSRGEARLRESGDPAELAKLLCNLGRAELGLGRRDDAAARRDEAAAILARLGLEDGSELGTMVAELRRALG